MTGLSKRPLCDMDVGTLGGNFPGVILLTAPLTLPRICVAPDLNQFIIHRAH